MRCQFYGITEHSTRQCGYLSTSALSTLPPASIRAPRPTFPAPYAHIAVYYSNLDNSSDWIIDSGASHHVTMDLAILALHESYIAFDRFLIGDGTCLSIANTGTPLPLFVPFYYLQMCYMCLKCLKTSF